MPPSSKHVLSGRRQGKAGTQHAPKGTSAPPLTPILQLSGVSLSEQPQTDPDCKSNQGSKLCPGRLPVELALQPPPLGSRSVPVPGKAAAVGSGARHTHALLSRTRIRYCTQHIREPTRPAHRQRAAPCQEPKSDKRSCCPDVLHARPPSTNCSIGQLVCAWKRQQDRTQLNRTLL